MKNIKELKPIIEVVSFKEMKEMSVKKNRDRYKKFPDRLPTMDKMPLPPDEHRHIGLYENKQNLYLLIANAYNKLQDRIDKLEGI